MPNPARPHPPGTTPSHRLHAATTKEATTTRPTPHDPTASDHSAIDPTGTGGGTASATHGPRCRRVALQARRAPRGHSLHDPLPWHRRQASKRRASDTARRLVVVMALSALALVGSASPAYAAGGGTQTLSGLISNLTTWIVGILAGVATLFLTIGGLRYLTAGGDPGQVEKAKTALKSAAVGYALAVLAPLIVSILASLVGGG